MPVVKVRPAWGVLAVLAVVPALACGGGDGGGSSDAGAPPSTAARPAGAVPVRIDTTRPVTEVGPRSLSVGLDFAQVAGGEFWDPTGGVDPGAVEGGSAIVAPYEFDRPELRERVAPLAPFLLRLGGTESDQLVYKAAGQQPGPGETLLTDEQWDDAMAFASAVDADVLVTLSATHRTAAGTWDPAPARALIRRSVAAGDPVVGWALGNEPNYFTVNYGGPTPEQLAADYEVFAGVVHELDPDALILGPSTAYWPTQGELVPALQPFLAGAGDSVDVVTWHCYPQQSERCPVALRPASAEQALTAEFLAEVDTWAAEVEARRDALALGAPVWLLETGNAQCGGQPGLSETSRATFWWLDELGRMARRGQEVVVRWNLSGADYAVLREPDLAPNPDWWASLLWRRLMGTSVLDVAPSGSGLRVYAHCAADGTAGGVTALVLNLADAETTVSFDGVDPTDAQRYLVTTPDLGSRRLELEGQPLSLGDDGALPSLDGASLDPAWVTLPPTSFAFVELPAADAAACR